MTNNIVIDRPDGKWIVNVDLLTQIVRGYTSATIRRDNFKVSKLKDKEKGNLWDSLFNWGLPEIAVPDLDWDSINAKTGYEVNAELASIFNDQAPMQHIKKRLFNKIENGRRAKFEFQEKLRKNQKDNMKLVENATDTYDTAVGVAETIRDTSAGTIMVGATFLSGGAMLTAVGAGSGLKATAKYQDTGNMGSAVFTGVTSFVLSAIPIHAGKLQLSKTDQVAMDGVLIFLEAQVDTANDLIEGKSLQEALTNAATNQMINAFTKQTGKLFENKKFNDVLKNLIGKAGIPAQITISRNAPKIASNLAATNEIANKSLVKLHETAIEKVAEVGANKLKSQVWKKNNGTGHKVTIQNDAELCKPIYRHSITSTNLLDQAIYRV